MLNMWLRARLGLPAILVFAACGTGYPVYDTPGLSFDPPVSEGLEALEFLVGCWRGGEVDGPTAEAYFSIGGAGTMLGWSRTSQQGRLLSWSFHRVTAGADQPVLEVWPDGQGSPARFELTESIPDAQATFEDPDHGTPNRIRYQLIRLDLMQITMDEGPSQDGEWTQLTMVRVACRGG